MTRNHGGVGSRYPIEATVEGETRRAVLFAPLHPTRRRSPDLSAYDRLDPPRPVRPTRYGRSRVEGHIEGMDRLRAALDDMAAKVNAATAEAVRFSAEAAMSKARMQDAPTLEVKVQGDPAKPTFMGFDVSVSPDRTVMGFRWPDGSIRPFSHKRSVNYW